MSRACNRRNRTQPSAQPAPDEERDRHESLAALLRAIENTEFAARLQQAESDAAQRPQPAPDEEPDSHETPAILLRAIESTELAGDLREVAPRIAQPDLPTPSELPKSGATLPALTFPVASPQRKRRIKRPLSAAPPQEAASSAVQQRGPLLTHFHSCCKPKPQPSSGVFTKKAPPCTAPTMPHGNCENALDHSHVLTFAPRTKSAAVKKAPDSAPLSPSALAKGRFPGAPFLARLKGEMRRLAPKIGASARVLLDSAEERLSTWLRNWLSPPPPRDQRRSQRLVKPPLVAYYWTGGTPPPQAVADISPGGLYLVTHDRLLPGTTISMTLQRNDQERETPGWWIAVDVMVIRLGKDGFAGAFIPSMPSLAYTAARRVGNRGDTENLERFVKHLTVSTQP